VGVGERFSRFVVRFERLLSLWPWEVSGCMKIGVWGLGLYLGFSGGGGGGGGVAEQGGEGGGAAG